MLVVANHTFFKKRVSTALLLACFLCLKSVSAQENVQQIVNTFSNYKSNSFQEKVFVHTDKNYYQAGEIIWFKVYNTDAFDNKPTTLSKIAYVEILDSSNTSVMQAKVGLDASTGQGSFYIPPNTSSGNFILRAYTAWMKNFDPSYFFEKKITIVNIRRLPPIAQQKTPLQYSIRFFPEGGNMVRELPGNIAFKATDQYGQPFNFIGYLLEADDTVLQFSPYKAGMGNFIFTPKSGKKYQAVIKPNDGVPFRAQLPEIYNRGYTMQLEEANNQIRVTAFTNVLPAAELYLVGHTRQSIKIAQRGAVENGSVTFSIDRSQLGDGMSHLTLFNMQREPVCERLYYKEPAKTLDINIGTGRTSYKRRNPVDFVINTSNADTVSLSMTVYKLDSLQTIDNSDIASYFYLTSDLGGFVENAGEYYANTDRQATNLLLLTHGWRRFDWKKILQNSKPSFEFAPEYSGHLITGRIVNAANEQPASNINTYLSSPSPLTQFKTAVSRADGSIVAEMNNFIGGTHLIAQTNPFTDSIYKVEINDPFSKKYSSTVIAPFRRPVNNPATLLSQNIGMQVQNIYLAEPMSRMHYPAFTDTTAFYSVPDARYKLEDYTRFTTIEEILREYVTLVSVRRRGGRVHLPMVNLTTGEFYNSDPVNLLDGVPVFNFNKFFEFDPLKMHTLELVSQKYVYGKSVFDGILNWKTYHPTIDNYALEPNALVLDYAGLQLVREFYSPVYDDAQQQNSRLPDFRNVLKWAPDIKIIKGNDHKEKIYTSDLPGRYVIIVQGIDKAGLPGSAIQIFDVQ